MLFDPGCSNCGCPAAGLCGDYVVRYCATSTTVDGASATTAKAGTTVEVYPVGGGALIDSAVTDATGTVRFCLPAGSYVFRVVGNDAVQDFDQTAAAVSTSRFLRVPTTAMRSGYCCTTFSACSGDNPPALRRPLYITDRFGTWAPTASLGCTSFTYASCFGSVPALAVKVPDPGEPSGFRCELGPGGTLGYGYTCTVMNGFVRVSRTWKVWTGGVPTNDCDIVTCGASGDLSYSSCRDLFASGSLGTPSCGYGDPIGGTVAVSL